MLILDTVKSASQVNIDLKRSKNGDWRLELNSFVLILLQDKPFDLQRYLVKAQRSLSNAESDCHEVHQFRSDIESNLWLASIDNSNKNEGNANSSHVLDDPREILILLQDKPFDLQCYLVKAQRSLSNGRIKTDARFISSVQCRFEFVASKD
ncbi:hypothetical protein CEXT_326751 [Caerostris extrusa]|uniref:Uncharacterized protein n=1 Tax=Caerostris extrusa TaxID=172846 RepID=A0AAV4YC60_CAEEX|nr:hypothetical protein CEXT_326751 [Caerostris extrusa]